MDIKEVIAERLGEMMRNTYRLDVSEVTSWEDTTVSTGYCETCYYEYAAVLVRYRDSKGNDKKWTYSESFADLINEL